MRDIQAIRRGGELWPVSFPMCNRAARGVTRGIFSAMFSLPLPWSV
jgi:hypothetical protein